MMAMEYSKKSKIRILHVITSLSVGGAEMMLYKLLQHMDTSRFENTVISVKANEKIGSLIKNLGVPVYSIKNNRPITLIRSLTDIIRTVRTFHPNLIQGWMYHGNLAALFLRCFLVRNSKLLWNIRHTINRIEREKQSTRLIIRAGTVLSSYAETIIYNSLNSMKQHNILGYCSKRQHVLPNGFDIERFRSSDTVRAKLRSRLCLDENAILIGHVARYHPMKNHIGFIHAACNVLNEVPYIHFVMVGKNIDHTNSAIQHAIDHSGKADNFHLMGECQNVPEIMAAFDIFVSSSEWGEAFPNAVGEAMACGLPCIVTDVGDSAIILNGNGIVVQPGDSNALTQSMLHLLRIGKDARRNIGNRARARIADNYSISVITEMYQELYRMCTTDGN
jgi:glycosyltransferase involved in cell wall biosynthesis